MIKKHTYRGFTLLETLLVTVVLAGVVLFTVMSLRSSSEQTLIEQTAVELQNWLTAELAYYARKSQDYQWATSADILINSDYLPSSAKCSVWPSATSAPCNNHAPYVVETTNSRAKYVAVSITLPNQATAQAVGRLLPMADVSSQNKVTAYAAIPASVSNQRARKQQTIGGSSVNKRGWITGAGVLEVDDKNSPLVAGDWCWDLSINQIKLNFSLPPCPSGFQAHYVLFYKRQMTGHSIGLSTCTGCHRYVEFTREVSNFYTGSGQLYYKAYVDNKADGSQPHDNYYMTMCLPKDQWFSYPSTTGDVREQQCDSTWQNLAGEGNSCGTKMTSSS